MTAARRRLSPEASRQMALDAARELLLEAGPQAVTLKAVAGRIGRTHANLLHHFGSAYELQKALAEYITSGICETIAATVRRHRQAGEARPRDVVDLAFDAFDKEGAGALASWMVLTGNEGALDPIVQTIHRLVDDLDSDGHATGVMHDETLTLVLLALGDSMLGAPLAAALGLPRDRARDIGERMMMDGMVRSGLDTI